MQVAQHRDQLIAMLCEAAEIEHCLMCCYLYAAFSLKERADEDLDELELAAVRRWRREVIAIATDEMLHLALVNNLLIAIGAPAHYRRYNFPIGPGLFPADIGVALAPLDEATLDHFVYVERPREVAERDGAGFTPNAEQAFARNILTDRLMPFTEDYGTVGELYETIGASFQHLHTQLGAEGLFVGPRDTQLDQRDFRLPGLCRVNTLDDALAAVHLIVVQGEGAQAEQARCHYARFVAIRSEWQTLKARRADFKPWRPAARNPVMRSPTTTGRVQILAQPASCLLDAGNAAYTLMLRLLLLLSDPRVCSPADRRPVAEQSLLLMHLIGEVGSILTTLPAQSGLDGVHAGLTFTVSRQSLSFASPFAGAVVLEESSHALGRRLQAFVERYPRLTRYAEALLRWRACWSEQHASPAPATADTAPASSPTTPRGAAVPAAPDVPQSSSDGVDVAVGRDMTVRFNTKRCIHARHCVTGEPEVFVANKPGEWIYPDRATPERLAIVAHSCPSGAITYERHDDQPGEAMPKVNVVRVRENGPLAVHANVELAHVQGAPETLRRATLCRCGQSNNKPFCDGSHNGVAANEAGATVVQPFVASGEAATRPSEPLPVRDGRLLIEPLRDGPLSLQGNVELCCGTGRTIDRVQATRLCRCGHSNDKPFCDGSHAVFGFVSDGV